MPKEEVLGNLFLKHPSLIDPETTMYYHWRMEKLQKACVTCFIALLALLFLLPVGCSKSPNTPEKQRAELVRSQLLQRGVKSKAVLAAFATVPREEFVLPQYKDRAYDDNEVPSGSDNGQSLDRAYEDAIMLDALALTPAGRVLEVGTGSGYLTSLLSRMAGHVFTIEIEGHIAEEAMRRFTRLGYDNITGKIGDGFAGWPEHAPFDAILLTCSPPSVPEPLKEQLAEGGKMIVPLGGSEKFQVLVLYKKENGKLVEVRRLRPATFSPMKGKILEEKN